MGTFTSPDIPGGPVREYLCGFMDDPGRGRDTKTVEKERSNAKIPFLKDLDGAKREAARETCTETCRNVQSSLFGFTCESVCEFPNMNYIESVLARIKKGEEEKCIHEHFRESFKFVNEREFLLHMAFGRVTYTVEDNKEAIEGLIRENYRGYGVSQAADVRLNARGGVGEGVWYQELERCVL